MDPKDRAIQYLTAYVEGVMTYGELVCWLAQLPPRVIKLIPEYTNQAPAAPLHKLLADTLETRRQIADPDAVVMLSSGIELNEEHLEK